MPNIKILFSNQIYTVLKKNQSCAKPSRKQSVTSHNPWRTLIFTLILFDVVWFCCFRASIHMWASVYVQAWAGIFWNLKNRVWLQSSERLHLENKLYDNSVLFWYHDWQSSNAGKQRRRKGEKQRGGKIEVVSLYLSCPKLSYSAASGGFCQSAAVFNISLPLSPPFHFSVWAFIYLGSGCLKCLGRTQRDERADDKYID